MRPSQSDKMMSGVAAERALQALLGVSFGGMLFYMALYFLGDRELYVIATFLAFAVIHYLSFQVQQALSRPSR